MKFDENFFNLFSQSISFNVNSLEVKKHFRELQKKYHPDKFANSTPHEYRIAVQFSAYINTAYSVLIDPIKRAEYLLEINGISYDKENITIDDADFLIEQMNLRELIDTAKKKENIKSINDLNKEIDSKLELYKKKFSSLINENIKINLNPIEDELCDCLSKMVFYQNLYDDLK